MFRIEGLHARYGRVTALHDASLRVEEGEIVGLIGPNGAGKTTTLRATMGVLTPVAGLIVFDGRSIVGQRPEQIVRLGLSLVPEGRRIFATLTVEDNLLIGGTAAKRGDRRSGIAEMFERFPVLEQYRGTPAGKLSGGEQQQLAIARALLSRPRLLLLDEPSLGLAPLVVDLLFDVLDGLRRDGVTILVVEQNARRTLHLADRTYIVRNGIVEHEVSREALQDIDEAELDMKILGFSAAA